MMTAIIVYTAFKVDIRPRTISITSIDSTVNTVTVNYGQTQESDFVEYKIYRNTTNDVDSLDEPWATISISTTTSNSITPGYNWIPRYYKLYQVDIEGLWSMGSEVVYGNIVNSPPATPIIIYPANDNDSMWVDDTLKWSLCSDLNSHSVKYRVMINYNNTGYTEFANELTDTAVKLTGYDSLSMVWKVIAYDNEGDSSAWSAERQTPLKGLVYDIDGNGYRYVTIGTQIWLVENLRTTKYNDGTSIPHVPNISTWANLSTGAYCYYDNTTNVDSIKKYGAIYNWHAVNTGKLSPEGWHVPTDAEWDALQNYLIANGYNWDGTTSGNKIAKAMAAKTDWNSSVFNGDIGNDMQSNNSTGFSALPGGYRPSGGNFYDVGRCGYWWSSTETFPAASAYHRSLFHNSSGLRRDSRTKEYGLSVRLLRD